MTPDLPAPGTAIEEVFVGVMGPIGSGKRSLIELIVGPQDDLLDPVTRSCMSLKPPLCSKLDLDLGI